MVDIFTNAQSVTLMLMIMLVAQRIGGILKNQTIVRIAVRRWMVTAKMYRIECSTEWESHYLYFEDKDRANLVFCIAVASKMFDYVSLEESSEKYSLKREWVATDET